MENYNKLTTKEFYQELLPREFPELYKNQDYEHNFCGIETGPGWHNIIYALSKTIMKSLKPEEIEHFWVQQIKEKFGTLRFYTSITSDDIQRAIDEAELLSAITCEDCGSEVQTGFTTGWMKCICYECSKKHKGRWNQKIKLSRIPDTYLNSTLKDWSHGSYTFCLAWEDYSIVTKIFRERFYKSYTYIQRNGNWERKNIIKKGCVLAKPSRKVLKEMKMMGFKINRTAWEIINEDSSKSRTKRF